MRRLVRTAALDLGAHGIRVKAVAPGPVATEALRERMAQRAAAGGATVDAAIREAAVGTALGRIVTVDEVAKAALFLACDLSSGVTGALLPVDAGLGLSRPRRVTSLNHAIARGGGLVTAR